MKDPLDTLEARGQQLVPLFRSVAKAQGVTENTARTSPPYRAIPRVIIGNVAHAKASDIVPVIRRVRARNQHADARCVAATLLAGPQA
jgi:hypothetical protein